MKVEATSKSFDDVIQNQFVYSEHMGVGAPYSVHIKCRSVVRHKSRRLLAPQARVSDFRRGGLKVNDQKKYTKEVKTVKARKSDGLV